MMKYATLQDAIDAKPCWLAEPDGMERLTQLFVGRDRLSAQEIAELPITHEERVWALTQPLFMSEVQTVCFALFCSTRVWPIYENAYPNHNRIYQAMETVRSWTEHPNRDRENYDAIYSSYSHAVTAYSIVGPIDSAQWWAALAAVRTVRCIAIKRDLSFSACDAAYAAVQCMKILYGERAAEEEQRTQIDYLLKVILEEK
jgi:hypothetical protein